MGKHVPHEEVLSAISASFEGCEIGEYELQPPTDLELGKMKRLEVDPEDGQVTFAFIGNGGKKEGSEQRVYKILEGIRMLTIHDSEQQGFPVYRIFRV